MIRKEGGLHTKGIFKKDTVTMPLVSIITVVFNGEQHLSHTIESVLNQTYPNIEYILIDGGSTDNTLSIINNYESSIDYWLSERDKGISDAFNKGLQLATGSITGLINADDWYELDAVETIVQKIGNADIIYGNLQYWQNNHKTRVALADHRQLRSEVSVNHPATFIKRKAYEVWGVFSIDYRYAMDYDLMLRFYEKGARFIYCNIILTNMRTEGISDSGWLEAVKEVYRIKLKHGIPKYTALFQVQKIIVKTAISKFLLFAGLNWVIKVYKRAAIGKTPVN